MNTDMGKIAAGVVIVLGMASFMPELAGWALLSVGFVVAAVAFAVDAVRGE